MFQAASPAVAIAIAEAPVDYGLVAFPAFSFAATRGTSGGLFGCNVVGVKNEKATSRRISSRILNGVSLILFYGCEIP